MTLSSSAGGSQRVAAGGVGAAESVHAKEIEAVLKAFQTDPERGLSLSEAAERLLKYGLNELPREKRPSLWLLFFKQFHNGLTYILLAAALLSLFVGHANDAAAIAIVVLINVIFSFVQERRAEQAIAKLSNLVVQEASVVRDGEVFRVAAATLVPGDILILHEGDRVTADCRLLSCKDLRVNESSLTGESLPVIKLAPSLPAATVLPERKNMVWTGTTVAAGHGRAVVIETGSRTVFGQIAVSLVSIRRQRAPFESRIDRLGWSLGVLSLVLAAVILLAGWSRGFGLIEMFFFTIAMAVAVIPEGLPTVLAVVLAIGVQRMARRKAIIRHVPSVETLGVADVICTDKTGTLTENKMTVRQLVLAEHEISVSGDGWEPKGDFMSEGRHVLPLDIPEASLLLKAAALCNGATLEKHDGRAGIVGDPTEGAMAVLAAKAGLDKRRLEGEYKEIDEIPFSSERRYRSSLVRRTDLEGVSSAEVFVIGAYEAVLAACDKVMVKGRSVRLDQAHLGRFDAANEALGGRAMRILAVAVKTVSADKSSIGEGDILGLTLVGLAGMIDPPRAGVKDAIASCRRAGIRVIMITGDHKATAVAVAGEIGLLTGTKTAGVLTEAEIAGMSEEEFVRKLRHVAVFARITPGTKLRIVRGLQKMGHTVAMTGDGVNDAPALKQADIGVAMGVTGTDVSKEVADMVLADDNFVTIVNAVEEGRVVFRNIKLTTAYLFTTNMAEAVTILSAIAVGLPLPLLPAQILWMNLVTDGFPNIALATEPADSTVLAEPPRRRHSQFITPSTWIFTALTSLFMCGGTFLLFVAALGSGDLEHARSVAFTTMACFQLWNILNMRSALTSIFKLGLRSNPYVIVAILLSLGLQIAVLYLPFMRSAFGTEPIGLGDWASILLVSSSILAVGEVYKVLIRRGLIPRTWI